VVIDKVKLIAANVAAGDMENRKKALELGAYDAVVRSWAKFCNSGIPGVRLLTYVCKLMVLY